MVWILVAGSGGAGVGCLASCTKQSDRGSGQALCPRAGEEGRGLAPANSAAPAVTLESKLLALQGHRRRRRRRRRLSSRRGRFAVGVPVVSGPDLADEDLEAEAGGSSRRCASGSLVGVRLIRSRWGVRFALAEAVA